MTLTTLPTTTAITVTESSKIYLTSGNIKPVVMGETNYQGETTESDNKATAMEVCGYAIGFHPASLMPETISFLQDYNNGEAAIDKVEARNVVNFQRIGNLSTICGQFTVVLATSTFRDPQVKQNLKVSLRRFFAKTFPGRALEIKGNTVAYVVLKSGQAVNIKGKVVKAPTEDEKRLAKEKADKKAALLLEAEQTSLRLAAEESARKQAEALAAELVKKQNSHDDEKATILSKSKATVDILSQQVADLTRQLEYARHETAATIREYESLKSMILGKTTIQALRAKVSGRAMDTSKPEMTAAEVVIAVRKAA